MRISVVMPAYNEELNIETTIRYCFETLKSVTADLEVVVVNDGSTDNTGNILQKLQYEFDGLKTVTNRPNQGYGAAMNRAIEVSTGDAVVCIDSDGQFDIADTKEMFKMFDDSCDILSGYRKEKKDSVIKVAGDRIMNRMIRLMFGVSYKDTNCALKILRGHVIRSMNLEARGFQFPTEIMLKAHVLGYIVKEFPVNHIARKEGASSLAPVKTAWQMWVFLCYLRKKIKLFQKGVIRGL